jgi:DNA primase catalytic subunit
MEPAAFKPLTTPPTDEQIVDYYRNYFPAEFIWTFLTKAFGGSTVLKGLDISIDKRPEKPAWTSKKRKWQPADEGEPENIMIRYLSASSAEDLRRILVNNVPIGVSFGSLYRVPGDLRSQVFPQESEALAKIFSVDFDLRDFTRTCNCGAERTICGGCWKDNALRTMDLTAKKTYRITRQVPLFNFSGRGGWHGHIPDLSFIDQRDRSRALGYIEASITRNSTSGVFDAKVTKQMDHVIRMPLTLHSTGLVALPIDESTTLENACIHVSQFRAGKVKPYPLPAAWKRYTKIEYLWGGA